jgi:lipoprotein
MDMKKYLFIAASALALASCSSEDFVGTEGGNVENGANKAINFSGNAGKITRATKNTGTAAEMLDGQFKIYGVKKTSDDKFKNVFVDYSVWDATANTTTSNTKGWEYVGAKNSTNLGTGNISLGDEAQTIKYWDYSASEYRFVAGSPISAFQFNKNQDIADKGTYITSATISGLAGHIEANKEGTALNTDPVYVATPKVVKKDKYQEPVQFEFNRQQAMVRVGIYETIPGYAITAIKFYAYDDNGDLKVTDKNNIILTSGTADYFVGGSNVKGTINYDWTGTTPSYTYAYTEGITKSKNWYAGYFEPHHALATTSAETVAKLYGTDKDMSSANGYFTVLPTPSATKAAPIIIKCDYTLTADDKSGETIEVTGATAAIPEAFSKWEVNTRYTYLFKISDKTNGTTGDPNNPKDPAGLYPITFDAAVTEMTDKTEGTTTTFTAPSITTYQKGSVEGNTIKYVADKNIDVTVLNDKAEVQTLKTTDEAAEQVGHIAVYKFDTEITEAEVQVKGVTGATKIEGSVDANNVFTFKPTAAGWYAIKYLAKAKVGTTPAVYTYKVVYVAAATK